MSRDKARALNGDLPYFDNGLLARMMLTAGKGDGEEASKVLSGERDRAHEETDVEEARPESAQGPCSGCLTRLPAVAPTDISVFSASAGAGNAVNRCHREREQPGSRVALNTGQHSKPGLSRDANNNEMKSGRHDFIPRFYSD